MYNIIAMDHPSLKPDNSIIFNTSFLRTVKYNNFVLPNFLTIITYIRILILTYLYLFILTYLYLVRVWP